MIVPVKKSTENIGPPIEYTIMSEKMATVSAGWGYMQKKNPWQNLARGFWTALPTRQPQLLPQELPQEPPPPIGLAELIEKPDRIPAST